MIELKTAGLIHINRSDLYPIIVIGMHRSGTSLVARILSTLGVHIGNELDIHDEAVCFKEINKQLLQDQGSHWAKPEAFICKLENETFVKETAEKALQLLEQRVGSYGIVEEGKLWAWKDPRNTITLPVWLEVFPYARVVHVVRNGIDVALSLHRREVRRWLSRTKERRMLPPTLLKGYMLWKEYLGIGLSLEDRYSQSIDWMTMRYEDIIFDPVAQVERLCQFLPVGISQETERDIAENIVRTPTKRSALDTMRARILLRVGLIDNEPLMVRNSFDGGEGASGGGVTI